MDAQDHRPETEVSGDTDRLIHLIGHDLRAASRALIEIPGWIAEDNARLGLKLPPETLEMLDMISRNARRLDRMFLDLLDYSRIGRKQAIGAVDWSRCLDQTLEQLPLPGGFELLRDLRAPAACLGEADAARLLRHLIGNAVAHHDKARGTIHISTRRSGRFCLLTVADDGPGIPEHLRDTALSMFKTLLPRDEVEGSGIGLAAVVRIAETYGGWLDWPAPPGNRGLAVRVALPLGPLPQ